MYKIGEAASILNTSVRTLRYYDEIGLIKPKEIDLFTGYRYYSKDQINDFQIIKLLKEAGFSLEEIKNNKDNFSEELMLKKKNELLKEITNIKTKIKQIDYLRSYITNGKIVLDKEKTNKNNMVLRR